MNFYVKNLIKLFFIGLLFVSCQENSVDGIQESLDSEKLVMKSSNGRDYLQLDPSDIQYGSLDELMAAANADLAKSGLNVRVAKVEYMTSPDSDQVGQTIFANDRTKQLDTRWVPNDPRRLADGTNITFLNDPFFQIANGSIDSGPSIVSSFNTWDSGTRCSDLPIVQRPYTGGEPNYVLGLFFGFPANPFLADITTTGFLPGFVFDILAPGGSNFILGVCFTLVFVDENGEEADANNDGKVDTALKEVWYNDAFTWTNTGSGGVDIETVALHENGHALDLGHFGKIFVSNKNGKLHFAPRAVMNASYTGVLRDVKNVTNAAHCSQFGSWPNN